MSISLDMTAVLESHGIVATPGNHQCPECGSRTGLSVNFKKNIASCFACGIKFYPTEFQEFWYTKFLASLYNRCRKALENPETNSATVAYLRSRGLEPDDYKYEPLGMIPQGFSAEKWVRKAEELKNEENTKLQKNMDALDGRNKKGRAKILQEIEQNNTIFAELQQQLEAANYASGWLAFFYVNHRGDFVSVNLRNHAGEGYKQIKGTRHKGIFSPVWGGTPAIVPGEVLLVEGEFNLLTFRKAYKTVVPDEITSAALGSASSWDVETVRKFFDGLKELCVNYDNDTPGKEAVNTLAESGSLWAFAVPTGNSRENDADYFIKAKGILEFVREWTGAERIYRSWDSGRAALDEIARDQDLLERDAHHEGLALVQRLLRERGSLYNCGNVATWVDAETHEIVQVEKGGLPFGVLLSKLGIFPGDKFLPPDTIGKYLGSVAQTCPEKTIYTLSFYNTTTGVLYVNEYGGYFLRIDPSGKMERLRNGDEGMLFTDGKAGECDPLCANLEFAVPLGQMANPISLEPDTKGLNSILDTINYAETGIGQRNSKYIIMTALLGLFFPERIPSSPYLTFHGVTSSMKTSVCNQVGRLVQGRKFRVRIATEDERSLKDMAISIPFLVLDEANNIRRLTDVLKAISTGAMDSRRELYTTANMRHTPYQAKIWMTSNTANLSNESISGRICIIDVGARTEENPYRSEYYLNWSDEERNWLWTELIVRLAAATRLLAEADKTGAGDMAVSHRMSSFFVFGATLAKMWGHTTEPEYLEAMHAMEDRQRGASLEGNEIVELLDQLAPSYNNKPLTAKAWSAALTILVPPENRALYEKVLRTNWVSYQFSLNHQLLTQRFGLKTSEGKGENKNVTLYRFSRLGQHFYPELEGEKASAGDLLESTLLEQGENKGLVPEGPNGAVAAKPVHQATVAGDDDEL